MENQYNEHTYTAADGSAIDTNKHIRNLGVTLSRDENFTHRIQKVARTQSGRILCTLRTRERYPMLMLYKSLVIPLVEYYFQLLSPWRAREKQSLGVQWSFTGRISDVWHLDYWRRLCELDLYSLERRRERYPINWVISKELQYTVRHSAATGLALPYWKDTLQSEYKSHAGHRKCLC